MMDALNALVKPAPETATGAKTTKGGKSADKEGFAHELKGLNDQQSGGKASARGAETKTAKVDAEAGAMAPAEPVAEETVVPRSFAALSTAIDATFETAIDATLEKVVSQPQEATPPEAGTEATFRNTKTPIGKPAKTKDADFSGLGVEIEGKKTVEGSVASEIIRKVKIAATQPGVEKTAVTKDAPADDKVDVDSGSQTQADIQPETLNDVLGFLTASAASAQVESKPLAAHGRTAETKGVAAKSQTSDTTRDTAPTDDAMEAMPTDEVQQQDRLFRLVRGEGQGQSVGLKIASDSNGRIDVETRSGTGAQAETVNVVEARRYLGFNAPSNSSSLTAAMAGNDEWVSAMHPSARLANEAQQSSTGQVVNTLKLELNPISLGTVTAMLRLSGDELNVHLTVHTAAAYRELSSDSNSMMDALRSQGFSVDQVTVSMAPVASSQDSGDSSGRFSQQQQQQNMQQAAGEGSRNGDQGARQNARGGSDSQPGVAAGRIDESEQVSSVLRGSGSARPGHVYI